MTTTNKQIKNNFKFFSNPSYYAGFSIIELIIVLLVSGIISTIVIPNYSKIQHFAKENNLKQTAYTLQMALETYYMENSNYPTETSIDSLLSLLNDNQLLKQLPENVYTNSAFSDSDSSGLLTYVYDADNDNYTLEVFGQNNEESLLILEN